MAISRKKILAQSFCFVILELATHLIRTPLYTNNDE